MLRLVCVYCALLRCSCILAIESTYDVVRWVGVSRTGSTFNVFVRGDPALGWVVMRRDIL